MTADINPVQFGRMIEALENLTAELKSHRREMGVLNSRVEFLESRYALGKWGVGGLVLVVGFAMFGVKETLRTILQVFAG